jgi:thymidine phosphorylase
MPVAPRSHLIRAARGGFVTEVRAGAVGVGAAVLGAGRERAEDRVDHGVGVGVLVRPGDPVQAGDPVLDVTYRDAHRLGDALPLLEDAVHIGDRPPAPGELVLEVVR